MSRKNAALEKLAAAPTSTGFKPVKIEAVEREAFPRASASAGKRFGEVAAFSFPKIRLFGSGKPKAEKAPVDRSLTKKENIFFVGSSTGLFAAAALTKLLGKFAPLGIAVSSLFSGYYWGRNKDKGDSFPGERFIMLAETGLLAYVGVAFTIGAHFSPIGPLILILMAAGYLWGRKQETGKFSLT